MNLESIPPWCLYSALSTLPPEKIIELSKTSKTMNDICSSQPLWKQRYVSQFPTNSYHLSKEEINNDWYKQFQSRYFIPLSIG